ncbi:MAG: nucleotidyltransferase domain-containing protein [Promethearchaeota archaeon]
MLLLNNEKILEKLVKKYPPQDNYLLKIILFGSVAKGNFRPDSDIDILLLTKNPPETRNIFSDFKMEILLEYYVIINAMYTSEIEYERSLEPIYKVIKKEGKILWERKKIMNKL